MRACPYPAAGMCWYSRNADRVLRTKQRGHGLLKRIFGGSPRACFSEMCAQRRKVRGHGRDVGMIGERRAPSERGEMYRFVFHPCDLSSFRFFVCLFDHLRPCTPVPDRQRRSGTGGLRLFFRGRNFFFSYSFCLLPPIDQKPFRAGQAHFCGSLHIQETRLPRRGGGAGYSFSLSEDKVKKFDVFFGILRKVYLFYDIITNIIKITFRA